MFDLLLQCIVFGIHMGTPVTNKLEHQSKGEVNFDDRRYVHPAFYWSLTIRPLCVLPGGVSNAIVSPQHRRPWSCLKGAPVAEMLPFANYVLPTSNSLKNIWEGPFFRTAQHASKPPFSGQRRTQQPRMETCLGTARDRSHRHWPLEV